MFDIGVNKLCCVPMSMGYGQYNFTKVCWQHAPDLPTVTQGTLESG